MNKSLVYWVDPVLCLLQPTGTCSRAVVTREAHEAKVRELEERLKDRDAEIEELTRTVARIRTEEIKPIDRTHRTRGGPSHQRAIRAAVQAVLGTKHSRPRPSSPGVLI